MGVETYCDRIERYLKKENVQPLIVDVQNPQDYHDITTHFRVGENRFISAASYCKADELPRMESLLNEIAQINNTVFVTGISEFLKLQGDSTLRNTLKGFLSLSTTGHVIFLTYQCKKYLTFSDPRLPGRLIIVDSDDAPKTELVFTTQALARQQRGTSVKGIDKIACIEEKAIARLLVITGKRRDSFPFSILSVSDLNRAYDILCSMDSFTQSLAEPYGTEEQWNYALEQFERNRSWTSLADSLFGNHRALDLAFHDYTSFDNNKKWLYFIALKLFGAPNNMCLNAAVNNSQSSSALVKAIYRSLMELEPKDKRFPNFYAQRKRLLALAGNPLKEVVDYCKLITIKGKDALLYLTDNTQKERETIFAILDQHGMEFEKKDLLSALNVVYPDLRKYLTAYRFKNDLLSNYFEDYKYQKVVNKIFPEFIQTVEEQAEKREYNLVLEPRTAIVESIDRTDAQLYFMDAMGVEYLGFIVSVCQELGLFIKVSVCRCELPSITSKNKEFVDLFSDGPHPIVSIKEIDEIKHHGKDTYDYQRTKLPIHLVRELDIIREVLSSIKERLISGAIAKAIMIADHGASRLAVIHETENIWEMAEKGEHSGRCCLKSEIDAQPPFATDAGEYWALANYDRFRGSRKANVEVHGGATLEEVTVPIIELTYSSQTIEVHLLPLDAVSFDYNNIPEITVSFRKKAAVKIYVSTTLPDVSVVVDGKQYQAIPTDDNFYVVQMPDLKRPRTTPYLVDVYSGDTIVASQLPLKVKSEGMGSSNKGIL